MAVVVLTSATGSPGVTTSALVLAQWWPRDVLLVDADRTPSMRIESGYLRGVNSAAHGMVALAQAHRSQGDIRHAVWALAMPLGGADDTADGSPQSEGAHHSPQRRFLAGFSHPGAPELFGPVWPELGESLADLEASGVDVIIDVGRLGTGLPAPLVGHADLVLVVVRASLTSLAALRLNLPILRDQVSAAPGHADLGLLLVGPGRPYTEAEVSHHFGVAVLGTLPWDPQTAEVYSEGTDRGRRHHSSGLVRSGVALSQRLHHRLVRRSLLVADEVSP